MLDVTLGRTWTRFTTIQNDSLDPPNTIFRAFSTEGEWIPYPTFEEQDESTFQIVVAGRDLAHSDPRFVFARHSWRTDNHVAALGLIEAGLGWGWQPRALVQSRIKAGTLVLMPFENLSNGAELWVDLVWSKERPLGLGARRFVALMGDAASATAFGGAPN